MKYYDIFNVIIFHHNTKKQPQPQKNLPYLVNFMWYDMLSVSA